MTERGLDGATSANDMEVGYDDASFAVHINTHAARQSVVAHFDGTRMPSVPAAGPVAQPPPGKHIFFDEMAEEVEFDINSRPNHTLAPGARHEPSLLAVPARSALVDRPKTPPLSHREISKLPKADRVALKNAEKLHAYVEKMQLKEEKRLHKSTKRRPGGRTTAGPDPRERLSLRGLHKMWGSSDDVRHHRNPPPVAGMVAGPLSLQHAKHDSDGGYLGMEPGASAGAAVTTGGNSGSYYDGQQAEVEDMITPLRRADSHGNVSSLGGGGGGGGLNDMAPALQQFRIGSGGGGGGGDLPQLRFYPLPRRDFQLSKSGEHALSKLEKRQHTRHQAIERQTEHMLHHIAKVHRSEEKGFKREQSRRNAKQVKDFRRSLKHSQKNGGGGGGEVLSGEGMAARQRDFAEALALDEAAESEAMTRQQRRRKIDFLLRRLRDMQRQQEQDLADLIDAYRQGMLEHYEAASAALEKELSAEHKRTKKTADEALKRDVKARSKAGQPMTENEIAAFRNQTALAHSQYVMQQTARVESAHKQALQRLATYKASEGPGMAQWYDKQGRTIDASVVGRGSISL